MGDGYHHGNLKEQLILAGMEIITKEGVGALSDVYKRQVIYNRR